MNTYTAAPVAPIAAPYSMEDAAPSHPEGVALRFASDRKIWKILACLQAGASFYWNKLLYNPSSLFASSPSHFLGQTGTTEYFRARDEHGILRGGNLPWAYMQNIVARTDLDDEEKVKTLRIHLASLPADTAFTFKSCPHIRDRALVHQAFVEAGFIPVEEKTHLFRAYPEDGDIYKMLKSDARNKTNAAKRDLEVGTMSLNAFFDFYKANLENAGKDSYFNLDIDRRLLELARERNPESVHVIAVRRKAVDESAAPAPVDAAIICLAGTDGYLKMLRITYRHDDPTQPAELRPHKHATKLVMLECMNLSVKLGLTLDSDGSTPGSEILYSRFGVFKTETRIDYHRKTAATFLQKPLNKLLCKLRLAASHRTNKTPELFDHTLFAQDEFQTL